MKAYIYINYVFVKFKIMILNSLFNKSYQYLLKNKRQRYISSLVKKGLKLGKNISIIEDFFFDPSHCFLISIGSNTTISPNVRLIAHDASTKKILGYTKIGKIDIGENCFLGDSVIVLPKVKIGSNSIIGSGSVVTKDIPPNSIVAGNPAKVISNLDEYKNKIKNIAENKKVFDKEYHIEKLDNEKRKEIIQSIGNSIGFIV